jgi:hypothetical protein
VTRSDQFYSPIHYTLRLYTYALYKGGIFIRQVIDFCCINWSFWSVNKQLKRFNTGSHKAVSNLSVARVSNVRFPLARIGLSLNLALSWRPEGMHIGRIAKPFCVLEWADILTNHSTKQLVSPARYVCVMKWLRQ